MWLVRSALNALRTLFNNHINKIDYFKMKFVSFLLFFSLMEIYNIKRIFIHGHGLRPTSNRISPKLHGVKSLNHKSLVTINEQPENFALTNIGIGAPVPQRLLVQFDTTFKGLWVFSTLYHTCDPNYSVVNETHKLWNETDSLTYKTLSSNRLVGLIEKGDEWVFGYQGQDQVSILNVHIENVWFTQVLKASNLSANINYDGVLGLQYDPKKGGFLVKVCEKMYGSYIFSIHYPRIRAKNSDFSDGVLTLCGDDKSKYNAQSMTYVDEIEPGSWKIQIERITAIHSSKSTEISSRTVAALDTTLNYIEGPEKDVEKIYNILRYYSVTNPEKSEFNCFVVRLLPKFIFSIGGIDYSIQGFDYVYEIQIGNAKGCKLLIKKSAYNKWTLGEPFFRKYYAKFDMNEHRIGFAENQLFFG